MCIVVAVVVVVALVLCVSVGWRRGVPERMLRKIFVDVVAVVAVFSWFLWRQF